MTLFQAIVVPSCSVSALATAVRTLRSKVARRSGFAWTVIWFVAALAIAFPSSTTRTAAVLGIGRGADLVLYLTTLSGIAASVYFYVRHRRVEVLLTGVIRREALRSAHQGRGPIGDEPHAGAATREVTSSASLPPAPPDC